MAGKAEIVKLIRCATHECENTVCLKYLGKKALDGGYTMVDNFEELPKDWMYVQGIGYLCHKCAKNLKNYIRDNISDDVAPCWK